MDPRSEFFITARTHLGLNNADTRAVLRIAQTLHTWAVHECNGTKQREEREVSPGTWEPTGRVHWYSPDTGNRCGRTPDLETGALKRLQVICIGNGLGYEHQGDPRGYVVKLVKDGREFGVPSRG
jgi:hypothetical protein